MSQNVSKEGRPIEVLAAEYAAAVRVWLPAGSPAEYKRFIFDGGFRGSLVKGRGFVEQLASGAALPFDKQDANATIRKIERLESSIRAAVDRATLVILVGNLSANKG